MTGSACDSCGAPVTAERQGDIVFCAGRPAHPNLRPVDDREAGPVRLRPLAAAPPAPAQHDRRNGHATPSSSSSSLKDDDDDDGGRRARVLTLGKLRERYSGAVAWLVEGYVALGELTLLPGPQESLKSWLATDLARAVMTGGRFLNHFDVVTTGTVIYIEAERANNLVYQTQEIGRAYGIDLASLIVIPPGVFLLRDASSQALLRAVVDTYRPVLIAINSFRSVFRGKAADGVEIAEAFGWLGQLAEDRRIAVVVVDQLNKPGGLGAVRGMAAHGDSLQKEYEADTVLHVERGRDAVGRGSGPARLYVGKRRAGESGQPFAFEVQPIGDGAAPVFVETIDVERTPMKPAIERVWEHLGVDADGTPVETLAAATGLDVGTIRNKLTDLRKAGRAEWVSPGRWRRPDSPSSSLKDDDDDDGLTAPWWDR